MNKKIFKRPPKGQVKIINVSPKGIKVILKGSIVGGTILDETEEVQS